MELTYRIECKFGSVFVMMVLGGQKDGADKKTTENLRRQLSLREIKCERMKSELEQK